MIEKKGDLFGHHHHSSSMKGTNDDMSHLGLEKKQTFKVEISNVAKRSALKQDPKFGNAQQKK